MRRPLSFLYCAALFIAGYAIFVGGCAAGERAPFDDDDDDNNTTTGAGAGGAGGSTEMPCGIDCSTIQTDSCHETACNLETLQCEVVNADDGGECDDGLFCTVNDHCEAGECIGGGANDCSQTPDACQQVICNEQMQACQTQQLANNTPCTPSDLCQEGGECSNGLCIGVVNDCFFAPVPNSCYSAVCNPSNGECEPVPDNEGDSCTDPNDLCTVGKTCNNGSCDGGAAKDCSALTVGCFNGECDTTSGQCYQDPVPAGGHCAEGDDQCTTGECDSQGNCIALPDNQGLGCDDFDPCLENEVCDNAGVCGGGGTVTVCMTGDGCCPSTCNAGNDIDCACGVDKLELSEVNIGNSDYIQIHNPTVCPLDLDPVELEFDDSSISDLTVNLPAQILLAGATVYVVESGAINDDIPTGGNISFSATRGGVVYMCDGNCDLVNGTNVVDMISWEGSQAPPPLASTLNFTPGPVTGITSSTESTTSFLRANTMGLYHNFFQADWTTGPATR